MRILKTLLIITLFFGCNSEEDLPNTNNNTNEDQVFYKGMDLSFQTELEDYNVVYNNANGTPVNLLDFVAAKGTNLVRLKLWHTSQNGENTLEDVKAYAQRIKAKNMAFLLDFHYSDYWADPANQTPPTAWQNLSFDQLKIEIYNYTKDVVQELKDQNTLPEIIQIGNETDSGFLWNFGRVWDDYLQNWPNYATLVKEAVRAVREVDASIKVMIHNSSVELAYWSFEKLTENNVDYDMIGLSYYPQFQTKDLDLIQSKFDELATTFNKEIMLVEVAYPFTLSFVDDETNFIGNSDQILDEFTATPQGQKAYFEWLIQAIKNIPNNKGVGFCYWAPDWVAFSGNETTSTSGTSWENQCIFGFNHNALPVFDVYAND